MLCPRAAVLAMIRHGHDDPASLGIVLMRGRQLDRSISQHRLVSDGVAKPTDS